jgi:membrane protein involved in colicin uptake
MATAEEKAAAKAAKDAEKAAAKAAKDAEKAAAKAASNSDSVTVNWAAGSRVYSKELHGEDFADFAAEFAQKKGGTIA